jgi:hypothetical protein
VPGTITNNQSGSRPKYGWVIKYEYQLSDGTVLKGRTQRDRTYRQGQVVTILYDPNRPRRSEIYPTKLGLIEILQSGCSGRWKVFGEGHVARKRSSAWSSQREMKTGLGLRNCTALAECAIL